MIINGTALVHSVHVTSLFFVQQQQVDASQSINKQTDILETALYDVKFSVAEEKSIQLSHIVI